MIVELGRVVADKQKKLLRTMGSLLYALAVQTQGVGVFVEVRISYKFLIKQMLRGRNQSVWMVPFLSHGIPGYGHGPGDDGNSAEGQGRTSSSPSRASA
jgi:hypothetical protein